MANTDVVAGQEVIIRSRALYDITGRRINFEAIVVANNGLTIDAAIRFNGIMLNATGIPMEMVAPTDEGN